MKNSITYSLAIAISALTLPLLQAKEPAVNLTKTMAADLYQKSTEVQNQVINALPKADQYDLRKMIPRGMMTHLRTEDIARSGPKSVVGPGAENVKSYDEISDLAKELERIVGTENLLPISFLESGVNRQKSVGRVILKAEHQVGSKKFFPGDGWGTGFLVSDSMLMTNNHVIPTKSFAKNKAQIQFNFQRASDGQVGDTDEYDLDPDCFFETNELLDFTLVRVIPRVEDEENPSDPPVTIDPGSVWGHLSLSDSQLLFLPETETEPRQRLSIVQHPQGRMKEVALHDNFIVELSTDFVKYTTDTQPASSGSPVFNAFWDLTALHHAGGDKKVVNGKIFWLNNEGIRIDRIVKHLQTALSSQPTVLAELGIQ